MRVALIGYGKVGRALQKRFAIELTLVRTIPQEQVACGCNFTTKYSDLSDVDVCIISVTDDSMTEVVERLQKVLRSSCVVLHTSGSIEMSLLGRYFENVGVVYPLYPFAQGKECDFSLATIFIEYNSASSKQVIDSLVGEDSQRIVYADSLQRKKIHIGAIIASNFVNHLVSLSQEYLNREGLSLEYLKPLLEQTFNNILSTREGISTLQTGPAARGDRGVIENHLDILAHKQEDSRLKQIYQLLTESIIEQNNGKKF